MLARCMGPFRGSRRWLAGVHDLGRRPSRVVRPSQLLGRQAAIIGLTFALAKEGERKNIRVNTIAPMAGTAMTADVFTDERHGFLNVEDVSPFVLALLHPACLANGAVIEAGGGWAAAMRWQRSEGLRLERPDLAKVLSRWSDVQDFTLGSDFPSDIGHSLAAAAKGERTTDAGQEAVR